jgi:LemA protein
MEEAMNDKQKIEQMIEEGTITPEQAKLLLHAVNESERRRQAVLEDIKARKKSRKNKARGIFSSGLLVALVLISILLHLAIAQSPGRDVQNALQAFGDAAALVEKQNYPQAIASIENGIERAPRFFLGYTMLGMTYQIMGAEDNTQKFENLAAEAFDKAANFREQQAGKSRRKIIGLVFLMIFVLLIISGICLFLLLLYNSLVLREEDVNESWSLVATYCQRRHDLIPLVMEAVKEFVGHEKETFTAVSEARNRADIALEGAGAMATEDAQKLAEVGSAEDALKLAMGKITAIAEQYPQLKTNTNYLAVQQELSDTENQIAYARQTYNQKVKKYNRGLKTFPFNLMAAAFGFSARTYFAAAE